MFRFWVYLLETVSKPGVREGEAPAEPSDRLGRSFVVPFLNLVLVILCFFPISLQAGEEVPVIPSKIGQPEDFSQLVGQFELNVSAAPKEVFVEDSIELKVRITGSGPNKDYLPQRKNLKLFPKEIETDFYLGSLPEKDSYDAKTNTWDFYYKLQPRHENVSKIPLLKLVYYNPQLPPEFRYQPSFSPAIPLKVKLRPQVIVAPERMYHLATGDKVLAGGSPPFTGWWVMVLGLLLPPAGSLLCYGLWRYHHPGQAALRKRHQSRAARQALRALQRLAADPLGLHSSEVVSGYLQSRLELPMVEPTPLEAIILFGRAGLSPELTQQVADFYRGVYERRFSPAGNHRGDTLKVEAIQLIQAVEEEIS